MTDNDSWPVGGTRLRPTFRNDASWDGIGHVPADWEKVSGEPLPDSEDDWETVLAAALGITGSGATTFPEYEADAAADRGAVPPDSVPVPGPVPPPAYIPPPSTVPVPVDSDASPPPTSLHWAGDDILPNRGNGRRRWRFLRR